MIYQPARIHSVGTNLKPYTRGDNEMAATARLSQVFNGSDHGVRLRNKRLL